MTRRYAIYFAPAGDSALARLGNTLIGWDAEAGQDVPFHPAVASYPSWREWTEEPRRYGLHATLKAPYELALNFSEEDLLAAVDAFAGRRRPFMLPPCNVTSLNSFVALVPDTETEDVNEMAEACVRVFDRFRAPMGENDRQRRLRQPLTERQRAQLDTFGYPHIFKDFRFHITLTGPLPPLDLDDVRQRLALLHQPLRSEIPVRDIAVFRQETRQDRFRLIHRSPLLG